MSGAVSFLGRPRSLCVAASLALALTSAAPSLQAQSLKGSAASLDRQNQRAKEHDFTFLRTASQLRSFVERGYLVAVRPNADFELVDVSFPYARPEVKLFVERLAAQYRAACGRKLVVTSLTRPTTAQPSNASDRSVHPTGMAIDLRLSAEKRCRSWLEETLLALENGGVLEATRERSPPHYHVALFPRPYVSYLEQRQASVTVQASSSGQPSGQNVTNARASALVAERDTVEYRVRRGDSLWTIARKLGTSVERLKQENRLASNRIYAGQVIAVPAS